MPTTAGDSEPTTTTPRVPAASPTTTCATTARWQIAIHGVVTDITDRPETDGQLLVLLNSDCTQPIVKAAA